MKPTVPCQDCPNRKLGCHGSCGIYLSYAAARQAEREARKQVIQEREYFFQRVPRLAAYFSRGKGSRERKHLTRGT